MPDIIKIRKGLNIPAKGEAKPEFLHGSKSSLYALVPDNFTGVIPKPLVKEGDEVKAGSPVFYHKDNPDIIFVSPVSGKIKAVNRGERRKILSIGIEPAPAQEYLQFETGQPASLSRENIVKLMLQAGLWPFVIQRPFGVIANPADTPKAIFISGFDTAPLAPSIDFIMQGEEENFQVAVDVLQKLTNGKIHVGVNAGSGKSFFEKIGNIRINRFSGPHPAGNVGVQIHHISPLSKGEIIWVIRPEDMVIIGKFFRKGIYDASRVIALAGSEVKNTGYIKTIIGAQIGSLVSGNVTECNNRYISGNILTGYNAGSDSYRIDGYLGFYDRMVTVIPEGNYYEFFGWALPGLKKFSMSKTFAAWVTPAKKYTLDTNYHGAKRAFVMTGEYEKVVPMDIYPQHLVKAAMIKDIELMENLGIYEVVEEDLALCEFACTSKIEVQSIIREALDYIKKEMS